MKLNNQTHFDRAPIAVEQPRSTFDMSYSWRGTGKNGELLCPMNQFLYPGDTVDVKVTSLLKLLTPLTPTMDNIFLDTWSFFIPMRLTWEHTKEFFGENDTSAWVDPTTYTVPNIDLARSPRAIGDYFSQWGIPYDTTQGSTGSSTTKCACEVLSGRAVAEVWNEWFRDQNTQAPIGVNKGDTGVYPFPLDNGTPVKLKVNRVHDAFGSCLPQPQKGDAVRIALSGYASVLPPTTAELAEMTADGFSETATMRKNRQSLVFKTSDGTAVGASTLGTISGGKAVGNTSAAGSGSNVVFGNQIVQAGNPTLSNMGIDVEALRLGLMTEHILEVLATSGSRYCEFIRGIFGIVSPDARLDRPEFIGHSRKMLNMAEVTQTSATVAGSTPIGHQGGVSKTVDDGCAFTYTALEHGFLLVFCATRTARSYSQGIPPRFQRFDRFDFYMPQLANLGYQPIYKKNIFLQDTNDDGTDIFGYQEPWYDLRTSMNINSGLLDPAVPAAQGGLGQIWTYGDYYTSAPTLSADWMAEDSSRVDRTLAVTGTDQYMLDIWFSYKKSSVMPVYSIPGLTLRF